MHADLADYEDPGKLRLPLARNSGPVPLYAQCHVTFPLLALIHARHLSMQCWPYPSYLSHARNAGPVPLYALYHVTLSVTCACIAGLPRPVLTFLHWSCIGSWGALIACIGTCKALVHAVLAPPRAHLSPLVGQRDGNTHIAHHICNSHN